ncbi:hypothetical protein MUK42_36602 [Musa troglodytarum]|uniref:Uncharacterized protein n=1 Tax=Musa troglodytarum TaxID=320322 RepID=A0A9E7JDE1_9LILI|nr:hypothetical protein MUK42_36602 [Musa troglodytarum]
MCFNCELVLTTMDVDMDFENAVFCLKNAILLVSRVLQGWLAVGIRASYVSFSSDAFTCSAGSLSIKCVLYYYLLMSGSMQETGRNEVLLGVLLD